jgi:hypothetical protein
MPTLRGGRLPRAMTAVGRESGVEDPRDRVTCTGHVARPIRGRIPIVRVSRPVRVGRHKRRDIHSVKGGVMTNDAHARIGHATIPDPEPPLPPDPFPPGGPPIPQPPLEPDPVPPGPFPPTEPIPRPEPEPV